MKPYLGYVEDVACMILSHIPYEIAHPGEENAHQQLYCDKCFYAVKVGDLTSKRIMVWQIDQHLVLHRLNPDYEQLKRDWK